MHLEELLWRRPLATRTQSWTPTTPEELCRGKLAWRTRKKTKSKGGAPVVVTAWRQKR